MAPSLPADAKPRLQQAYALWLAGRELRELYPRRTFFTVRRELLPYGVDIGKTRSQMTELQVQDTLGRPLKDFLRGPGMDPPEWADEVEWLANMPDAQSVGA